MPRHLVERTYPGGLDVPARTEGSRTCAEAIGANERERATWVHCCVHFALARADRSIPRR